MALGDESLNVEDVLKGLSSETRLVIIDNLKSNSKPAVEIFNDISIKTGIKNRETVYRALEKLVEIKVLEKKYDNYQKRFLYKIKNDTITLNLLSDQVLFQNRFNQKIESIDTENVDISFSKVPQYERTKHVHGIHPYQGKFIPQLVEYLIKRSKFTKKDIILDPFMGSGTTNVECKLRHIDSAGIEISEFNCLLTRIKISNYDLEKLKAEIKDFEKRASLVDYSKEISPSEYLKTWFSEKSQKELLHMVDLLKNGNYIYSDVLKVIVSRIARSARLMPHYSLEWAKDPVTGPYFCHKHNRTCYPTENALKFLRRYCWDSFERIKKRQEIETSMNQFLENGRRFEDTGVSIFCEDARTFKLPIDNIAGIITSPPYLGIIDYHEQHRYAYELFGFSWRNEKEIGPKSKGYGQTARDQYKKDMISVFGNLHESMKDGALVNVVVGDKLNMYPEIFRTTGFKTLKVLDRPVDRRTSLRAPTFSEKVFIVTKN
jgi:DNA modification methylase